jgi:hypothetical protein
MTNEEIGTLWAERNALEAIVTNLRAERDALRKDAAEFLSYVERQQLEFQIMQKHAQQDADEILRLRALVESAYREGFYDGEDNAPIGELLAGYGDTAWWMSDARKALEVQP